MGGMEMAQEKGKNRFNIVERIADPDLERRVKVFEQIHRHRSKIWGNALVKLLNKYPSSEIPAFISHFLNMTETCEFLSESEKEKGNVVPSVISARGAIMVFAAEAGRRFISQ